MFLACIVLRNLCIDLNDECLRVWDLTLDEDTQGRRSQSAIRDILHMTRCNQIPDSSRKARQIRDNRKQKLWTEKLDQGVH